MSLICPVCNNEVETGYSWEHISFCPYCGYDLKYEPDEYAEALESELELMDNFEDAYRLDIISNQAEEQNV